ncbi:hypothetical protein RsS62_52340 [Rhizobium dioscoreae]|nr:hypothetical protein RsS62_52340 [Rhizobium dioscoreae]
MNRPDRGACLATHLQGADQANSIADDCHIAGAATYRQVLAHDLQHPSDIEKQSHRLGIPIAGDVEGEI